MWKNRNMKVWMEFHGKIWPELKPPSLLQPLASQNKSGTEAAGHFVESTLPSSVVWACFCHQSLNPKRPADKREAAASVLYDIMMAGLRTGRMKVRLLYPDRSIVGVDVPSSGNISAELLFGHMRQQDREDVQARWLAWTQDCMVCVCAVLEALSNHGCDYFLALFFNSSTAGRQEDMDGCLGLPDQSSSSPHVYAGSDSCRRMCTFSHSFCPLELHIVGAVLAAAAAVVVNSNFLTVRHAHLGQMQSCSSGRLLPHSASCHRFVPTWCLGSSMDHVQPL